MNIFAYDSAPLPIPPSVEELRWLRDLLAHFAPGRHVLALDGRHEPDGPVVSCERDGSWWGGRYVGTVQGAGRSLTIEPRVGVSKLAAWLGEALGTPAVGRPPTGKDDQPFVTSLLATVWGRSLAEAARFGPAPGPVTRLLAAAYRVLLGCLGRGFEPAFLPERVRELLPALLSPSGSRAGFPEDGELDRLRWTPGMHRFAGTIRLSRLIVRQRALLRCRAGNGTLGGVLLDLSELWEHFVRAALHRAAGGTCSVLKSPVSEDSDPHGSSFRPRPAACCRLPGGRVLGVVEARYGNPASAGARPQSPPQEDLYRLAACLGGFPEAEWGAILYPSFPDRSDVPLAEEQGPWRLDSGQKAWLLALPCDLEAAAARLQTVLFPPPSRLPRPA
jgi:5-methylcytosine-specific restriction enzyme subunit McrC